MSTTENTPLAEQTCANCGSTELRQDTNGVWHCLYCRSTFRADDPRMIVVDTPNVQQANENVVDTADMFTFDQQTALSQHLRSLRDRTDVVVVVETVNTITQNVEMYARQRAHELGVGDAEKDNGIFILMVREPRRVQVVAGNGIAPHLTGSDINAIVASEFVPQFKAGDLVGGLTSGADALVETYRAQRDGRASSYTPRTVSGPDAAAGRAKPAAWKTVLTIAVVVILAFFIISGLGSDGSGSGGNNSDYSWDSGSDGGSDWGGGSDYGGGGSDFGGGGFDSGSSGGSDW